MATPDDAVEPRVELRRWGEVDGVPVHLATLTAGRLRAAVSSFGATLVSVEVPAGKGEAAHDRRDVILGRDALDDGAGGGYVGRHPYLGGTVGRVANRIAWATFDLDGVRHRLVANDGPHHLHGGPRGFDRRPWSLGTVPAAGPAVVPATASAAVPAAGTTSDPASGPAGGSGPVLAPGPAAVDLTYLSPDGEEGYPGEVRVRLRVSLDPAGVLAFELRAVADRPTPVALAHHPYFALAGHDTGSVLGHELRLWASRYLPTDADGIPTGEVLPVDGTPFDFRRNKPLGVDIDRSEVRGVRGGYDVAYLIDGAPGRLRPAAHLRDPGNGLFLELHTTQPSLQVYTANDFDAVPGKRGARYGRHAGVALEAQAPPDAVHHPQFGDVVLRPGQQYRQRTEFRFGGW